MTGTQESPEFFGAYVGRRSSTVTYEVERGAIRRFAEALGDENFVHIDVAYARSIGFTDLVAPPTFVVTFMTPPLLEIDPKHLLLGSRKFTFTRPIVAGDVVECESEIVALYERAGRAGPLTFVETETTGRTSFDQGVMYTINTVVIVRDLGRN